MKNSSDLLIADWRRARPDIGGKPYEVLLRLRAIAMLMDQQSEHVSKSLGLKRREVYMLLALRRSAPDCCMRPTDIFKLLRVTSGTLTYRIDRLEELGLVRRLPDPEDRRSYIVELTDKGRQLADKAVELEIEALASPIRGFLKDRESVATLNSLLQKLAQMYDAVIPTNENPIVHQPVFSHGNKPAKASTKGPGRS